RRLAFERDQRLLREVDVDPALTGLHLFGDVARFRDAEMTAFHPQPGSGLMVVGAPELLRLASQLNRIEALDGAFGCDASFVVGDSVAGGALSTPVDPTHRQLEVLAEPDTLEVGP